MQEAVKSSTAVKLAGEVETALLRLKLEMAEKSHAPGSMAEAKNGGAAQSEPSAATGSGG